MVAAFMVISSVSSGSALNHAMVPAPTPAATSAIAKMLASIVTFAFLISSLSFS